MLFLIAFSAALVASVSGLHGVSGWDRRLQLGETIMVIVLVHWKITPGMEDEFFAEWQRKFTVHDRAGLVGEFLCSPCSASKKYPWITWEFDEAQYKSFINVAVWGDADQFKEQVGAYFNDGKQLKSYEAAPRVRTVLQPKQWRMGDSMLPVQDSDGVL